MKRIDFGDYVIIEQKRFGVPNEMYIYKVIGRLKTNNYVDVPVQIPRENILHKEVVECVAAICCGVIEDEVRYYRLEDVKSHEMPKRETEEPLVPTE